MKPIDKKSTAPAKHKELLHNKAEHNYRAAVSEKAKK